MLDFAIDSSEEMEALGGRLCASCATIADGLVFLCGELGAGKTTLVRGFLRAMGYTGGVKSPTYTLVEPYEINGKTIYHFDFYRLQNAQELSFMGIRDYFQGASQCLVEWPDKAEGFLPEPDVTVIIRPSLTGRRVTVQAMNERGKGVVQALNI